jgi:hypothetical protein
MWNIDPIQIKQYCEKHVPLREITNGRGRVKE